MGRKFLAGITHPDQDVEQIKDIGFNAIRLNIPFPFENEDGELCRDFLQTAGWIDEAAAAGLSVAGITANPGDMPDWAGKAGSDKFYRKFQDTCRFLSSYFKGKVVVWQIGNEMNLKNSRKPLDADEAVRFAVAGIHGILEGNPGVLVGINMAELEQEALYIYDQVYNKSRAGANYIGSDGYFGTWHKGGPDRWYEFIKQLYNLAGMPIIVHEWGFASEGGAMTPEELASGVYPCSVKKWRYTWGEGHTRESQAEYIRRIYSILLNDPRVIGCFYYAWNDGPMCWQCGQPDCPCEKCWGIFDTAGNRKPSWYAHRESLRHLKNNV
ncbi:MAG: hypothetical protein FIA99_06410 [Ruminiclostridium sp.]|nr:hypothetical protein [Ruminiclostridium sp.]